MKEKLINEYVKRLTIEDVNKFALSNGIDLKDKDLNLLYTYIKNEWHTIIFGNPRKILDDLKIKLDQNTYAKIETLYIFFKDHYNNL